MAILLPGDAIPPPSSSSITVGPGIASSSSRADAFLAATGPDAAPRLVSTRMGMLGSAKGKEKGEQLWVEGRSRRYIAAQRELVLGTIIARHAEGYRVDIGTSQMASLDALAFEGATKRSKPNLKVGTLVYARVSVASRDMEPELECVDPKTGKAEGFGELKGGLVISVALQTARHPRSRTQSVADLVHSSNRLLNPKHPLLSLLAAHFPFETAIGMNGRIWLKAGSAVQTIALKRILEAYDRGEIGFEKAEVDRMVRRMLA